MSLRGLLKFIKPIISFTVVSVWIFSDWSQIWKNLQFPPIVSFAQEVTSTAGAVGSTPPIVTSSEIMISTFENTTSNQPTYEILNDDTVNNDEEVIIPLSAPESSELQLPPLKERKLNKQVWLDKNIRHFCVAKNFTINISSRNQIITEIELAGMRSDLENLEIGSLPLGIDITFLNNGGYNWRPSKSDNGAILQITNQSGSQKGNFSVPIIYQRGDSTTICQINIINQ